MLTIPGLAWVLTLRWVLGQVPLGLPGDPVTYPVSIAIHRRGGWGSSGEQVARPHTKAAAKRLALGSDCTVRVPSTALLSPVGGSQPLTENPLPLIKSPVLSSLCLQSPLEHLADGGLWAIPLAEAVSPSERLRETVAQRKRERAFQPLLTC